MTAILDTSILVMITRRGSSISLDRVREALATDDLFITAVSAMELLQGAYDHADWQTLQRFIASQELLEPAPVDWTNAARTFFELRRVGQTMRSALDCIIAEIAMRNGMMLVHGDRDFEKVSLLRPLNHRRLVL
jgi:hypothetical protein